MCPVYPTLTCLHCICMFPLPLAIIPSKSKFNSDESLVVRQTN